MIDVRTTPAPIETVTPIKPSEAIRLGCIVAPVQAFHSSGAGDTACAMGAMMAGWTGRDDWGYSIAHSSRAVRVENRVNKESCPVADCVVYGTKPSVIPHLNDDHRWSRERIADWLEGLGL